MVQDLHLRKRLAAWCIAGGNGQHETLVATYKRRLFARLRGNVLEIGPGAGANLAYFPLTIHWIGIEPNPFMHPYLKLEAQRRHFPIDLREGVAEHVDIADHSMDFVVGTLVLCSVTDQRASLREIARVLKPGGQYLFVEHVAAARGTGQRRMQNVVQPLWSLITDDCHPNRETWQALDDAGFSQMSYERFSVPIPIASPHIAGFATR